MKRRLFTFALAALTIGLLGSCSKINERIDGLDKRVYDLENTKIASVEQQIATINQSIADLSTIRTNIQTLMDAKTAMGEDITKLKAADQTLEGKINDLKTYVDTELAKYATKDWANATFATLATQKEIITDVEKLKTGLVGLDTKLDQAIANLDSSLKGWVNTQLSAYYKKAEIDVKVGELQAQITTLKEGSETNKTKIAELESNLKKLTQDLEEAKATIRIEYEKAIKDAIEVYNGTITKTIQSKIDEVNATIAALTGRVDNLETAVGLLTGRIDAIEAMIQSVSITPAYSDGSVEAVDGILTLKCIVSPAEALIGMESLKDSLLIYADSVKVKTKATTPAYMTIEVSEASVLDADQGAITLTADISDYLPKGEDKALTVAVNVKNGISDFTTKFVSVTVAAAKPTVEYVEIGGLKWATKNLGAEKVTDYGDYFAWGETAPYYEGTGGWPTTPTWKSGKESGYAWQSYCGKSSFSEWSTPPYDATTKILKPEFDAAAQILGDGWRMPTSAEFKALYDACLNGSYDKTTNPSGASASVGKGVYWCTSYDGVAGCLFCDGTNKLFFPAAGSGDGTSLGNAGSRGYYWSSSLLTGNTDYAYDLFFYSSNVSPQASSNRCYGFSVRPVSTEGVAPAPTPTTTGTAKATIGGKDVDVKWVQLWENGPKFAEYNATEAGWGANWCTPSKDDLEHLLNAASGKTDEKVTCEHTSENSVWGFKFTGKEDGYTNNSVFFPNTSYGSDAVSTGYYWSSTYDSDEEGNWLMTLSYIVGNWYSGWCIGNNDYFTDNDLDKSLVKYRLVLSNK